MKKWNKRLILLLILVLIISVLSGCGSKKVPEGVSKEFYNDMIFVLSDMSKTISKTKSNDSLLDAFLSSEGLSMLGDYEDKSSTLTIKESSIVDNLKVMYINLEMYHNNVLDKDTVKQKIEEISKLLELDIDLNDYVF